jgi:hypothetical protein
MHGGVVGVRVFNSPDSVLPRLVCSWLRCLRSDSTDTSARTSGLSIRDGLLAHVGDDRTFPALLAPQDGSVEMKHDCGAVGSHPANAPKPCHGLHQQQGA